jgi:hypothetical protein
MSRIIPAEYFENRQEQANIQLALTKAIPANVYYHNLIMALLTMLERAIAEEYKTAVYGGKNEDDN